jgi:inosine/xanthosine triphosphate pyrophosphatase family protein
MSTERLRGTCFSLSGERSSPSGYDPVRIVEETGGKGTELSVEERGALSQ